MRIRTANVLLAVLCSAAACEGQIEWSIPSRGVSPGRPAPASAVASDQQSASTAGAVPSGDGVDPVPSGDGVDPVDPPSASDPGSAPATDPTVTSDPAAQSEPAPAEEPPAPLPDTYLDKLATTPDYCQTAPDFGGFPGSGAQYCAPVSFSNALMWLDANGFPALLSNSTDAGRDQFDLASRLAAAELMDTDLATGTSPSQAMSGLKKYLAAVGVAYKRIAYQGWRWVPAEFRTGVDTAQLDWIKRGVLGASFAWINVGWYDHDPTTDQYTRKGGHWVTVVGFGSDSAGAADPGVLVLHDPATCGGQSAEHAATARLPSGTLTGANAALPRSAAGQLRITRGIAVASYAQIALVDGAVVLEL